MSVCGFGLRGKEVGTPIPRLGYGLHLPLMAPAPGDRSPQGYINLDEDPSPRSFVKLSVNRSISSLFVVSFLFFLSFLTSLSLNHFWLFTAKATFFLYSSLLLIEPPFSLVLG